MPINKEQNRIIDFHVHTSFSDGYFKPHEIIEEGIRKKIAEICITDHYSIFKPALKNYDFELYFNTLSDLQEKFSSEIKVYIGIEVDTSSTESFTELLNYNWDLILFEYVFSVSSWEKIFQKVINFKKTHSSYNIGLAHTRFRCVSEKKFEYVQNLIRKNNIIIELNTNYRNYMDKWFNYLDSGFLFSIGSDAHNLVQLGNIQPALNYMTNHDIMLNQIITL